MTTDIAVIQNNIAPWVDNDDDGLQVSANTRVPQIYLAGERPKDGDLVRAAFSAGADIGGGDYYMRDENNEFFTDFLTKKKFEAKVLAAWSGFVTKHEKGDPEFRNEKVSTVKWAQASPSRGAINVLLYSNKTDQLAVTPRVVKRSLVLMLEVEFDGEKKLCRMTIEGAKSNNASKLVAMFVAQKGPNGVLVVEFGTEAGTPFNGTPTFVATFKKVRFETNLSDETKANLQQANEAIAKLREKLLTVVGTKEDDTKMKTLGHGEYPKIFPEGFVQNHKQDAVEIKAQQPNDAEDVVPF